MPADARPDAASVAARAWILREVVATAAAPPPQERDGWPRALQEAFARDAEAFRLSVLKGLGDLAAQLTPWEREFFAVSVADLWPQQYIDGGWRLESLCVLLWALGVVAELPSYDAQASVDILDAFGQRGAEDFRRHAALRPPEAVEAQRQLAELWHWRSRMRQDAEFGEPESDVVRETARSLAARGVVAVIDEDLAWSGKPYRDLSEDEWSYARSIAVERHFALNWLSGYAPGNSWDETPTDT